MTSPLKPLGQCCSNLMGQENERLLNGHDPLTKMAAMPIYGKTFKKLDDPINI